MGERAVIVEELGKKYRIGVPRPRYKALRDQIAEALTWPLRAVGNLVSGKGRPLEHAHAAEFWALRNVSFEIKRGEVVGVIGRNGAGKSTLLKILSRITEPTIGKAEICGRVASLLEIGTGFHPELTGRENIYLNGAILGMRKAEINRRFDDIVAFAEVEKFIDTPVKHYSSGMYLRLAFAVAAHLETEIVLVDEVLAVGDSEFQTKCLGKMESVARGEGRTVLFVSHNLAAIEAFCPTTILLDGGRVVDVGATRTVVQRYLRDAKTAHITPLRDRHDRQGSGAIRFVSVWLTNSQGHRLASFQCGSEAVFAIELDNTSGREINKLAVSVGIDNDWGHRVLLLSSRLTGQDLRKVPPGASVFRLCIPKLPLMPGRYNLTLFSEANGAICDWIKNAASFEVQGGDYFGTGKLPLPGEGLFVADHFFQYDFIPSAAPSAHGAPGGSSDLQEES